MGDSCLWYVKEQDGGQAADCFYVHPTMSFGVFRWNLDHSTTKVCTGSIAGDPDLTIGQAGAFRHECNLWAPKYSEVGMLGLMAESPTAPEAKRAKFKAALEVAYLDVKNAFEEFMALRPDTDRPFIIAAHSQGSFLAAKVVASCIQGTPREEQFVAAYLAGGYLDMDLFGTVFKSIRASSSPEDTKVLISWDTRTSAFHPASMNNMGMGMGLWPHHIYWSLFDRYCAEPPHETDDRSAAAKPRLQINPGTWTASGGGKYLGANTSFQQKQPGVSTPCLPADPAAYAAQTTVSNIAVVVAEPTFCKGAGNAGGPGNLHPVDMHFWFFNVKDNVTQRLAAWHSRRPMQTSKL